MLAVIETGGKQYVVKTGDLLRIEKVPGEAGETITFDKVLLTANDEGEDVKVGTPYVSGATVKATVEMQGRAKKIRVVKFKRKVRYARAAGHRQDFTKIRIV